ncbi:TFIIB-like protein [Desulfobotulus alkaliphilus]|uniref:TFIIB-like protein n=1 Tax=Desulfobotulus alkaliphilus TaxID=622671 RepID=A0A562S660_9BACT|nr:zf-TFIIB domain-containing protein [Desulfobotulus alkaliphilus]TWI76807.1 TFIIB-like protein [Desulfobotulus alkaliphilus]
MKCPKCKTAVLKKSAYNSQYFCDQCKGMWLVKMKSSSLTDISIETIDNDTVADNDSKTGLCPSGHGLMIRAKVDIDEPFYLERCTACGGIWFDNGEWLRIAENNLSDNLSIIWSKSWQRNQSRIKNRNSFLETNKKLLGEQVFREVMELSETLKNHSEKDRAIALLQQEILHEDAHS